MIVRPYQVEDDEAVYRLCQLAFGGRREPDPEWFWSRREGFYGLVADAEPDLVGCMRIWDYRQFFGGVAVPMGGIAGVAVSPNARGQGVATAMLDAVLPAMRDAGHCVSALYPSVPPLYRTRGWEQVGNYERMTVRPELLALLPKPSSRASLRRASADDLPALHAAYLSVASTVDGMLDRSTPPFKRERVLELDIVDVVGDDPLRGYLIAERPEGEKIICHDLIALDRDTGLGLLANLARWTGIVTEVQLRIVDPAWWQFLMTLPAVHEVRNHPWMLRVVDLAAAIASRGWPAAAHLAPAAVDIEVIDEHAPWQAGRHRLVVEDGKVRCEPGGTGAVRLHTRGLAPWYAGSADTAMLHRMGLLEGDPATARLLDQLTGAPKLPRMADAF